MKQLVVLFSLALAACATETPAVGCTSDTECPSGQFCDAGVCKCRTDDQCGAGEYCNAYGNCQERPACLGNQDCAAGFICNSASPTGGECIPQGQCGHSVHCEVNHWCQLNGETGTCVPGCRQTGDCQLGKICVAGRCETAATAADCHTCPVQPDPDPGYCDYGERCSAQGNCETLAQGAALCDRCDNADPAEDCPAGLICLIDEEDAGLNYCAPTCRNDPDCPNGYSGGCGSVIIVAGGCATNNDCAVVGGTCVRSDESNQPYCTFGDASFCATGGTCTFGFCDASAPCTRDADCQARQPGSTCNLFGGCDFSCQRNQDCACIGGRCPSSGMPCTPQTAATDCAMTFVPRPGASDGVCMTNTGVCGKESGYGCTELTTGTAACRDLAAN